LFLKETLFVRKWSEMNWFKTWISSRLFFTRYKILGLQILIRIYLKAAPQK
jgi:hypothetical protein